MFSWLRKTFGFIRKRKIAFSVVIFLFLVGAIYLPSRIRKITLGAEADYETVRPLKENLVKSIDASGKIRSEEEVTLKFQTSGKLAWVGVKEGDKVKKWQTIASLDKNELKKNLEKEVYDYLNKRWDFEQSHQDYGTSGRPLEKSILTDAAKRILEKAQFDLNKTVLDVEIADISYSLATILTPIEGIVTHVDAPVAGVNITPTTATFVVSNPKNLYFEAKVDEADIGQVKLGQEVSLTLDTYPKEKIKGTVDFIGFSAVTNSGGGTSFPIRINLRSNEEEKFKLGMNGDIEILVARKEDAISLPFRSIKEKEGKKYIKVIEKKKIKEMEIETGLDTDSRIEILTPLPADLKVVSGTRKKK